MFIFCISDYVLSYKFIFFIDPKILLDYELKGYFRVMPLIAVSVIFSFVVVKLNLIDTKSLITVTSSSSRLGNLLNAIQCLLIWGRMDIFHAVLFLGDNQNNLNVGNIKIETISPIN